MPVLWRERLACALSFMWGLPAGGALFRCVRRSGVPQMSSSVHQNGISGETTRESKWNINLKGHCGIWDKKKNKTWWSRSWCVLQAGTTKFKFYENCIVRTKMRRPNCNSLLYLSAPRIKQWMFAALRLTEQYLTHEEESWDVCAFTVSSGGRTSYHAVSSTN